MRLEPTFVQPQPQPQQLPARKTVLPALAKLLEISCNALDELERKDQLIEALLSRPPTKQLPRTLRVRHRGVAYDWLDLDDPHEIARVGNLVETLRENIAYYFGVPMQFQAIYGREGLLGSNAEISRELQAATPELTLCDLREPGARALRVEYCGHVYEWPAPELPVGLDAERQLRRGLERHFGLPPERQVLSDEHGQLVHAADFRRALEAPCPLVRLADAGDGLVAVQLCKTGAGGFGFAAIACGGRSLNVSWIDERGLLARWNHLRPEAAVRVGDELLEVNGASGDATAMGEELLQAETVQMVVRRPEEAAEV